MQAALSEVESAAQLERHAQDQAGPAPGEAAAVPGPLLRQMGSGQGTVHHPLSEAAEEEDAASASPAGGVPASERGEPRPSGLAAGNHRQGQAEARGLAAQFEIVSGPVSPALRGERAESKGARLPPGSQQGNDSQLFGGVRAGSPTRDPDRPRLRGFHRLAAGIAEGPGISRSRGPAQTEAPPGQGVLSQVPPAFPPEPAQPEPIRGAGGLKSDPRLLLLAGRRESEAGDGGEDRPAL